MKRLSLLVAILLLFGVAGCGQKDLADTQETGKIQVVATLFPQYDFARQVAGDLAEVTLLLPLGVESHTYEPTPADMVTVSACDLFLYTGKYMEPWAEQLIQSLSGDKVRVQDVSAGIALDEAAEGHSHEGGGHGYDPHIWTDPVLAKSMVDNVTEGLCAVDPANADAYRANAAAYQDELAALDTELRDIVAAGKRDTLVFGGQFAFHYLTKQYGLSHLSAYDSCTGEAEPSAAAVAAVVDAIRQEGIPVVYYESLTDPKVARAISEETGAEMLLLHSVHNLSKEEYEAGATYLSIMRQNAENMRKGLS